MNREWGVAVVCWLAIAGLSTQIHPNRYREGRSRDPRLRVEVNQSSLARILGEFRTGMSDMLFIKTERYLHSGVGYVPHLTEGLLTVQGTDEGVDEHLEEMHEDQKAPHSHDHDHDHEHGGKDHFHHEEDVETLLPTESRDYRGWIGRMHREVKPWRDPGEAHQHTDGKELIPWFKMMTVSDPNYIRGYVIGAFWVKRYDREAAMDFIEEGLGKNPEAFQLHLSKGMMLMAEARRLAGSQVISGDDPEQLKVLLQAKSSFRQAAEFMLEQRPKPPLNGEIEDQPDWGRYLETDAMAAVNLSLLFEERYGDSGEASRLRARFLQQVPELVRNRE